MTDLNISAVKKALASIRSNRDFIPLSVSALARSRADWLFGMNLTRAYTLAGQKAGFGNVLSVGRVQTPILGLVVNRDNEIANFVAKPFYEVFAHLNTGEQQSFTAKWQPSKACEPYQDEEGRVLHRGLAENVVSRIAGQKGEVTALEQKQKKQQAPLPYNLSALQIDAAKAFTMPAQKVLDICQTLYERHKLITYPRSDNRYLPKDHHREAASIVKSLKYSRNFPAAMWIAKILLPVIESIPEVSFRQDNTVILPVPVSLQKKISRGFNQCEIFGEELSRITGIEMDKNALRRRVFFKDKDQIGLERSQRETNPACKFEIVCSKEISSVLLIDDICTTGKTMYECKKAIKEIYPDCHVTMAVFSHPQD